MTQVGHCKRDETDVYIGRGPNGRDMMMTPVGERGWLGNPYTLEDYSREKSIESFRRDFHLRIQQDSDFRKAVEKLRGKTLGCWCRSVDEDKPACHGDVIVRYLEADDD